MEATLQQAKVMLRGEIRARLAAMTQDQREAGAKQLCVRLRQRPIWDAARAILFFAPFGMEPNVWPLMSEALRKEQLVALPSFDLGTQRYVARQVRDLAADLFAGQCSIREPRPTCEAVALNRLDLVLVPGVAFDRRGRRLGRGKGDYDRLLPLVSGTKCGVGFDEQIVEAIPTGPLDIGLNCILTPTRWIET